MCAVFFFGCSSSGSGGSSDDVLGTWSIAATPFSNIVGESYSNVVLVLTKGQYSLSYTGSVRGVGSQSGTINPSDPGPDEVITGVPVSISGNAGPSAFYLKLSSVTDTSGVLNMSLDNVTWESWGTATRKYP